MACSREKLIEWDLRQLNASDLPELLAALLRHLGLDVIQVRDSVGTVIDYEFEKK